MKKIDTKKAPCAIGPYSQAIITENFVFTSGQIAINPETNQIETTTIKEQTEQVIKNIAAILAKTGSSLKKTVKTTCFLADMNDFSQFNEIYERYFTEKPARSCIAVKQLPKNSLVEIEVIAEI